MDDRINRIADRMGNRKSKELFGFTRGIKGPPLAAGPEGLWPGGKRRRPKVGRNDPCPCGSGKKFKKCCQPR